MRCWPATLCQLGPATGGDRQKRSPATSAGDLSAERHLSTFAVRLSNRCRRGASIGRQRKRCANCAMAVDRFHDRLAKRTSWHRGGASCCRLADLSTRRTTGNRAADRRVANGRGLEGCGRALLFPHRADAGEKLVFEDVMNRPNSLKLPLLVRTVGQPGHPLHPEALDNLQLFVCPDVGNDPLQWQAAVDATQTKQRLEQEAERAPRR
jgi:hypothetical protein